MINTYESHCVKMQIITMSEYLNKTRRNLEKAKKGIYTEKKQSEIKQDGRNLILKKFVDSINSEVQKSHAKLDKR